MKLLDRIALERSVTLFLNFILAVLKLIIPRKDGDNTPSEPESVDKKRKWVPRWRRKK